MIEILLMVPFGFIGGMIAHDLGFGRKTQIVCSFICCFLASILIDML